MIKAAGRNLDGRPVLIVGLSNENVRRLKAGKPILFSMKPMGLPDCDVFIVYGPTEEQIEATLGPAMRSTTIRHAHDVEETTPT